MRKLLLKLRPKTTWAKVNLALTVVMFLAYGGLLCMRATMGGDYYPDPENCGAYFEDVDGVTMRRCCPEGLLFCPELESCVFPGDPSCTFDCETGGNCVPGKVEDDKVKKAVTTTGRECFIVIQEGDGWKFVPGTLFECKPHPDGTIYCTHACIEKYNR